MSQYFSKVFAKIVRGCTDYASMLPMNMGLSVNNHEVLSELDMKSTLCELNTNFFTKIKSWPGAKALWPHDLQTCPTVLGRLQLIYQEMGIFVSVIVPVFNSENYLEECIDSILNQDFFNYELILVDDGSTDSSSKILDSYLNHNNVHIFHKENGGVGSARNFGLDVAKGDWVIFIDSDDIVSPTYISSLYNSVNNDIELSVCNLYTDSLKNIYETNISEFTNLSVSKMISDIGLLRSLGPTCKLFKKEIIDTYNIKFPVDYSFGEDTVFTLKYLSHTHKCSYVVASLYYYRTSGSNSLSQKLIPARQYCRFVKDYITLLNSIYNRTECSDVFDNTLYNLIKQSIHLSMRHIKQGNKEEALTILEATYISGNSVEWNTKLHTSFIRYLYKFIRYLYKMESIIISFLK